MKIAKETVKYVADLARLNLSDEETVIFQEQMEKILGYMEKLNSLDTRGVKPMEHIEPVSNVFREDCVGKSFDRAEILANAPDKQDGAFRVPKIME